MHPTCLPRLPGLIPLQLDSGGRPGAFEAHPGSPALPVCVTDLHTEPVIIGLSRGSLSLL